MSEPSITNEPCHGIGAVERDTGLPKDTLRMWERRYGFPSPLRDAHGERLYPASQVEKLRLIRRLVDTGRRPSTLMASSREALLEMLSDAPAVAREDAATASRVVEAALAGRVTLERSAELADALRHELLKRGLQRFVTETVAPLTRAIGEAWMRGEIDIATEHLYTEQVQNVLRGAIAARPPTQPRPRVLLTTLPEEQHALGLLMAEAMLVPEDIACLSLGTRVPLADIQRAAVAGGFDIVGLSFSAAYPARKAVDDLLELRESLPAEIALWAGGAAVADRQSRLPGIRVVVDLADTLAALAEWRATNPH